jgi:hypothetical protein
VLLAFSLLKRQELSSVPFGEQAVRYAFWLGSGQLVLAAAYAISYLI